MGRYFNYEISSPPYMGWAASLILASVPPRGKGWVGLEEGEVLKCVRGSERGGGVGASLNEAHCTPQRAGTLRKQAAVVVAGSAECRWQCSVSVQQPAGSAAPTVPFPRPAPGMGMGDWDLGVGLGREASGEGSPPPLLRGSVTSRLEIESTLPSRTPMRIFQMPMLHHARLEVWNHLYYPCAFCLASCLAALYLTT